MKHQFCLLFAIVIIGFQSHAQHFDWVKPKYTYTSGQGYFMPIDIAQDHSGNSYALGYFDGTMVIDNDTIQAIGGGNGNNILMKYSPAGTLVWAIPFYVGNYNYWSEVTRGIRIDANDNIWLIVERETDTTTAIQFPDTTFPFLSFQQLIILDTSGHPIKTFAAGKSYDSGCCHYYRTFDVRGSFFYYTTIDTLTTIENVYKIDTAGNSILLFTMVSAGAMPDWDPVRMLKVLSNGDMIILGLMWDGNLSIGTDSIIAYSIPDPAYILRTDSNGNFIWGKSLGEINFDIFGEGGYAVNGDQSGNSYLVCGTVLYPFQIDLDFYDIPNGDYVLYKFDPDGNVVWFRNYSDNTYLLYRAKANDLIVNDQSEIVVIGRNVNSTAILPYMPDTVPAYSQYALKFDSSGTIIWTKSFGHSNPSNGTCERIISPNGKDFLVIGSMDPPSGQFSCISPDTSGSSWNPISGQLYITLLQDTADESPDVHFQAFIEGNDVYFEYPENPGVTPEWLFGDSEDSVASTLFNPSHAYTHGGTYNVSLSATNSCGNAQYTTQINIPGVESVVPNYSGNDTYSIVDIYGVNLLSGTTVTLAGDGFSDIEADTVIYFDSTHLRALFTFSNESLGYRDVVLTDTTGTTYTFSNGFEIQETKEFEPTLEIAGNKDLLINAFGEYDIQVGNNGNEIGFGVMVYIETKGDKDISMLTEIDTSGFYQLAQAVIDSAPANHFWVSWDSILNDSVASNVFMIPYILPGRTYTISLLLKSIYIDQFDLKTYIYATPIVSPDSVSMLSGNEYAKVRGGDCDLLNCLDNYFAPKLQDCSSQLDEASYGLPYLIELKEDIINTDPLQIQLTDLKRWANLLYDAGDRMVDYVFNCTPISVDDAALEHVGGGWEFLKDVWDAFDNVKPFAKCFSECIDKDLLGDLSINVITSMDPNIKTGISGINSQNFISNTQTLFYNINFENADTATAPANEVVIIDQLDTATLDISTLRFNGFGIGDSTFVSGIEKQSFVHDFDLRPIRNCFLRTIFELDTSTGLITWKFLSRDTATLDNVTNPFDGFLPPNVNAPEGEAFLSYHVKPKEGLPHLTVIANDAEITFDNNAPINTPVWINTIDTVKPESNVLALQDYIYDSTFMVHWSGTDADAGIMNYKIYVSVNDSEYIPWLAGFKKDSFLFKGEMGNKYEFYSIARDNVGNIEDDPPYPDTNPDATTTLSFPVSAATPQDFNLKISPNPFSSATVCEWYLPKESFVKLSLTDVIGKNITSICEGRFSEGNHKCVMESNELARGIYFLKAEIENQSNYYKLVCQ